MASIPTVRPVYRVHVLLRVRVIRDCQGRQPRSSDRHVPPDCRFRPVTDQRRRYVRHRSVDGDWHRSAAYGNLSYRYVDSFYLLFNDFLMLSWPTIKWNA